MSDNHKAGTQHTISWLKKERGNKEKMGVEGGKGRREAEREESC